MAGCGAAVTKFVLPASQLADRNGRILNIKVSKGDLVKLGRQNMSGHCNRQSFGDVCGKSNNASQQ